jgi:hypothetical protein
VLEIIDRIHELSKQGGDWMKNHTRKIIAPVVITVLLVLYLGFFMLTWLFNPVSLSIKLIGTLIPLSLIGVSVYVLVERIKEIRSGEEDDLSKY